ncbi:MAG TPA: hypothetical protein VJT31_31390, partial [Rugosimonospora sp.]|nr:hypothetical protein [Rugosimonospora sp.]
LAHRGCLAIPHTPALVPTLLSACDLVVAPRPDATLLRARAAGRPTIVYRPASDADRAEAEAWRTAEWAIPVSGPELLAEMVRAALERGTARPVVPGADPAPLIAGLADVPELVELPVVDAGPIG